MLLQASQKTRITRGARQAGLGFMAPMNRPRFLTANSLVEYLPLAMPEQG